MVYVSALRLESGELLIVITPESCSTAISDYGRRWGIETLFGMFKTRGFCLESTHFQDSERLSKLIALMTLALCWAVKTGEWLHQLNPIKVKKHGRKQTSIFRYGLNYLRSFDFFVKVGFDFLGYYIRQYPSGRHKSARNGAGQILGFNTLITPSKQSLSKHQESIKKTLKKHKYASQIDLINDLNPIIRG